MAPFSIDKTRFWPAVVLFVAVLLPVSLFARRISAGALAPAYPFVWALFTALTGSLILYTGRVSFFRRIFFAAIAALFLLHFKSALFTAFETSCSTDAPYCHIAMSSSFFNYLYQQYLAFMSGDWRLWGPLSAAFLWLVFTLVLGRAWCSWACFYGGIDDGLSALPKKALLDIRTAAARFRDLPAALLIFLLLVSLSSMLPVYCLWVCPFKLTAGFLDRDAFVRNVQLALMFAAVAALVIGPLLTRKRTFCSFLCPFGAWQSFWGRINPFRIAVEPGKCVSCGLCAGACPMSAIRCEGGGKAVITAYCNLCGECLEACPQGGFSYSVFGIKAPAAAGFARLLDPGTFFILAALVTGGTFAALFAPAALKDIADIMLGLARRT